MQTVMLGLSAMPSQKRARETASQIQDAGMGGCMVSSSLQLLPPHQHTELSPAARQRAQLEARAAVRQVDTVLEKILDVRVITTRREPSSGGAPQHNLHNHVNLRVSNEFSSMVHHERATTADGDIMFCFMSSSELEPVIVVVLVHGEHGRLVQLTHAHFHLLETALGQFRVRFGLRGETYSYTPLLARTACTWHSRHWHLKMRVPTEMYLRIFPAMQVLGSNHVCKRAVVEPFKRLWEPLMYKFELKGHAPWAQMRPVVLADVH
jgi:hypothetical protein